ncbi:MAG: hypothetical protein P8N02_19965, partial [Actinomycetota bacterium]|nr:hypothetical protein [Actinomycetota bacterium]
MGVIVEESDVRRPSFGHREVAGVAQRCPTAGPQNTHPVQLGVGATQQLLVAIDDDPDGAESILATNRRHTFEQLAPAELVMGTDDDISARRRTGHSAVPADAPFVAPLLCSAASARTRMRRLSVRSITGVLRSG